MMTRKSFGALSAVTKQKERHYGLILLLLCFREAIGQGFNHFKVKVGISLQDDIRRLNLVRSVIDDPTNYAQRKTAPLPETLVGKNAGLMGGVLMADANQGEQFPKAEDLGSTLLISGP